MYTVPDFSKWEGTKRVATAPKFFCHECNASGWCKYAPWVSGCDDDMSKYDGDD